jgi:hypothetical protein
MMNMVPPCLSFFGNRAAGTNPGAIKNPPFVPPVGSQILGCLAIQSSPPGPARIFSGGTVQAPEGHAFGNRMFDWVVDRNHVKTNSRCRRFVNADDEIFHGRDAPSGAARPGSRRRARRTKRIGFNGLQSRRFG